MATVLRFIALMMEAVRTSETSVNFNVTAWRYILEDSKLHTRCRENPKSHVCIYVRQFVINIMFTTQVNLVLNQLKLCKQIKRLYIDIITSDIDMKFYIV
jgi:hypothetical protein